MKNLKKIFVLIIFVLSINNITAQNKEYVNKVLDLSQIKENQTKELILLNGKDRLTGIEITQTKEGTNLQFCSKNVKSKKLKVELYNENEVITTYIDTEKNGPFPITIDKFSPFGEDTLEFNEKKAWWPIVVGIVLCCVHANVGSYEGQTYWEVGFDCDCLSVELKASKKPVVPVVINNKKYKITKMRIYPLGVDLEKNSEYSLGFN